MLLLREVLIRAAEFRQMALKLNREFSDVLRRAGIIQILEKDPQVIIEAARQKKIPFSGDRGALAILRLKKQLIDLQNLFYDFSDFLEPVDLLPFLERKEYRYIMTKMRENNEDLASACRIGNIMFAATLRSIVNDNKRWNLMMYRIKEKWRRQNIKRVV
ncbi:hypothetical protein JOC37_000524 [Desulfohalotomaculum tongense]|uniref:hypothetical protein n=1 Tax=Desulforadius tongensis TaxID=1216062 RepID=UPI00195B7DBE|nr:hypothetical protein [Desulforadius tongensis]MBM7854152.1 hypothetical protein [Desulforadius tongensis]